MIEYFEIFHQTTSVFTFTDTAEHTRTMVSLAQLLYALAFQRLFCGANALALAAWGDTVVGGDLNTCCSGSVQSASTFSSTIKSATCSINVCSAIFADGSAKIWGLDNSGADTDIGGVGHAAVPLNGIVHNVVEISCGKFACVAMYHDTQDSLTKAFAWGDAASGGDVSRFGRQGFLVGIQSWAALLNGGDVAAVSCGHGACAARFGSSSSGRAVVWGDADRGGTLTAISPQPSAFPNDRNYLTANVVDISCGGHACVARFADGSARGVYLASILSPPPAALTTPHPVQTHCAQRADMRPQRRMQCGEGQVTAAT